MKAAGIESVVPGGTNGDLQVGFLLDRVSMMVGRRDIAEHTLCVHNKVGYFCSLWHHYVENEEPFGVLPWSTNKVLRCLQS